MRECRAKRLWVWCLRKFAGFAIDAQALFFETKSHSGEMLA
jgi:hypothetical protein